MMAFLWSPAQLAAAAAATLLLYHITSTAYYWYRLRHVPGPFFASLTSLWAGSVTATGKEALIYADLAKKYGPLMRVGPTLVLTSDVDALRRISGVRSQYGKDGFYLGGIKHPDHDNMFTVINVPEHDKLKAQLAGPYGGRETLAMEPIVDDLIGTLIKYFRDKCANTAEHTAVVNLAAIVNYLTMDVITRVSFGSELGFLRSDSDVHGLMAANRVALRTYVLPLSVPWLRDLTTSRFFLRLLGPKPTDKRGFGVVLRVAEEAVKKRFEPGAADEKDLLGAFVRHGLKPGPTLSETLFAMVAGSDTTASAMRFTMLHLMSTPTVYNKLKSIVLQAVSEGRVSSPIKQEEAKCIPYLQAVIYEGLRMRPPVPVMFPKVVPPQGDEVCGKFLPGGTSVGWNLLPMMRDPRHWGRDPDLFRPERFLEADAKERATMERTVEMCFGSGRFACAGKPLAFMELNKFYFELFRHFDFQLVDPSNPWDSELWATWMEDNFMVHVTESCPV